MFSMLTNMILFL